MTNNVNPYYSEENNYKIQLTAQQIFNSWKSNAGFQSQSCSALVLT